MNTVARTGRVGSRRARFGGIALGVALTVLPPATAGADTGIPMLLVVWPPAWALFIPVVLVEAYVARRLLGLSVAEAAKLSFVANAWSTFVGIPLGWLALLLIEIVGGFGLSLLKPDRNGAWLLLSPLFAAWLGPATRSWHVYAAAACLCIPFMLVSVRVESWSAQKRVPADRARRWARIANLITYVPIICMLAWLAISSWIGSP